MTEPIEISLQLTFEFTARQEDGTWSKWLPVNLAKGIGCVLSPGQEYRLRVLMDGNPRTGPVRTWQ